MITVEFRTEAESPEPLWAWTDWDEDGPPIAIGAKFWHAGAPYIVTDSGSWGERTPGKMQAPIRVTVEKSPTDNAVAAQWFPRMQLDDQRKLVENPGQVLDQELGAAVEAARGTIPNSRQLSEDESAWLDIFAFKRRDDQLDREYARASVPGQLRSWSESAYRELQAVALASAQNFNRLFPETIAREIVERHIQDRARRGGM